jgi:hypothetical protein
MVYVTHCPGVATVKETVVLGLALKSARMDSPSRITHYQFTDKPGPREWEFAPADAPRDRK